MLVKSDSTLVTLSSNASQSLLKVVCLNKSFEATQLGSHWHRNPHGLLRKLSAECINYHAGASAKGERAGRGVETKPGRQQTPRLKGIGSTSLTCRVNSSDLLHLPGNPESKIYFQASIPAEWFHPWIISLPSTPSLSVSQCITEGRKAFPWHASQGSDGRVKRPVDSYRHLGTREGCDAT